MQRREWKQIVTDYFSFSVRERWAVLVLLTLIIIVFVVPDHIPEPQDAPVAADSVTLSVIRRWDSLDQQQSAAVKSSARGFPPPAVKTARFPFDPNKIGLEEWLRLGLPVKTAHTILNYRNKGGRFRRAEDLTRIYGMPGKLAAELVPWVRISPGDQGKPTATTPPDSLSRKAPKPRSAEALKVPINAADSLAWIALNGIGPTLAGRILNFRNKLGGFYSLRQVGEVYGLKDSVFQSIQQNLVLDPRPLRQLSLNSAGVEELAAHPYIRLAIAKAIVAYRQQHGAFHSVDELGAIHLISAAQLEKIRPYCKPD